MLSRRNAWFGSARPSVLGNVPGLGTPVETARRARKRRLPAGRPPDPERRFVPWWLPSLFMLFALALAPWIVWLVVSLPSEEVAAHWEVAWGGFDIGLAALLVATAFTLAKQRPSAEIFASMTAAVLICDAWFDVVTSHGTTTVVIAVLEAVLVELPLAVTCIWIARNVERLLSDGRPFFERAGFPG
jgi:hypothetical protein